MKEFLELIYGLLSGIGTTSLEEAEQGAQFPYITYSLQPSIEDFQREIFILEVNVWDNSQDTEPIEKMADDIDKLLHRYKYYKKNELQTSIYRMNRSMIPDPNPEIRRRQLMFECKTYIT